MFAGFILAAALFLGLDFLQLGKLGGTARLCRVHRFRRWLRCRFRFAGSFDICRHRLCRHLGVRRRGIRLLHAFLKRPHPRGAFLRRQPVVSICRRRLRGCLLRRCRDGFGLWRGSAMRRRRRALAAHFDLDGAASGTGGARTHGPGLNSAKCQLAATGQAELLGFSAVVAHLRTLS